MVLNIEGVLGPLIGGDGEAMSSAFTLDSGGGTFLWLEREHHQLSIWANNEQTVLLVETMGLAVTIQRELRDGGGRRTVEVSRRCRFGRTLCEVRRSARGDAGTAL